jgi:hypothetical protein
MQGSFRMAEVCIALSLGRTLRDSREIPSRENYLAFSKSAAGTLSACRSSQKPEIQAYFLSGKAAGKKKNPSASRRVEKGKYVS